MPDNRTATVMLVDDEVMVATALRSFLELETAWRVLTFPIRFRHSKLCAANTPM